MEKIAKMGFRAVCFPFKKDYTPSKKRQPVYNFLKRTLDGTDIEKQKVKTFTINFCHQFFIKNGAKKARMLSLPGITWDLERKMRKKMAMYSKGRIKLILTGCESDYKVFCISAGKMPHSKQDRSNPFYSDNFGHYVVTNQDAQVYLLNADIFDVLKTPDPLTRTYDIVWLDTTNTVISICKKLGNIGDRVSKDCILIFTLLKGRERVKFDTNRTDYLSSFVSAFGFRLAHSIEYFDTCPMLHLIYTRTS